MMYRTREGEYVSGDNSVDIVAELHRLSWQPAPNDLEWMRKTASNVLMQTGKRVSTRSCDEFLAGLVDTGLLFLEEECQC